MKYFDNLYFLEKEISEEKFKVMEEKIQKTLDECNKYNYSPIEKVLFFYDKVKQFRYKDNGNPDVVRKLDDVIINEKGVCAGFVNAFNEYLLRTGFKCTPIFLTYDDNRKHTCEIADIDDDKYDIHGIYIFDPTFDSIDSSDMDRNLYYTFFAKELSEYDTAKEIFKFEPATSFFFKYSDLDINSINEINPAFFLKMLKGFYPNEIQNDIIKKEFDVLGNPNNWKEFNYNLISSRIPPIEKRIKETKPIHLGKLFTIINTVRQLQNPDFSREDLKAIIGYTEVHRKLFFNDSYDEFEKKRNAFLIRKINDTHEQI